MNCELAMRNYHGMRVDKELRERIDLADYYGEPLPPPPEGYTIWRWRAAVSKHRMLRKLPEHNGGYPETDTKYVYDD